MKVPVTARKERAPSGSTRYECAPLPRHGRRGSTNSVGVAMSASSSISIGCRWTFPILLSAASIVLAAACGGDEGGGRSGGKDGGSGKGGVGGADGGGLTGGEGGVGGTGGISGAAGAGTGGSAGGGGIAGGGGSAGSGGTGAQGPGTALKTTECKTLTPASAICSETKTGTVGLKLVGTVLAPQEILHGGEVLIDG